MTRQPFIPPEDYGLQHTPDSRFRFKGWTWKQRTFQWTGTFLIICAVGAFALLTAGGGVE